MSLTPSQLLQQLSSIKKWSRGDLRAPHKPLLLLLALARVQRGEDRLVSYADIELPLNNLLREYSPSGKTSAQYPFWHLQSDGLWELPERDLLEPKKSGGSAKLSSLRETGAHGGFPEAHFQLLKKDPRLVAEAARTILEAHFPASIHEDILSAVGLDLEIGLSSEARSAKEDKRQGSAEADKRPKRDPSFRATILMAYNWSCAVCGFKGWLEGSPFGVEAAHVRWHSHDGPSTVDNGLCLCTLHHKALDRGVIGIDDDYRLLVTPRLEENPHTRTHFFWFSSKELETPRDAQRWSRVAGEHCRWHRENCFRG